MMSDGDPYNGNAIVDIQVKTPDKLPKKKNSVHESMKSASFRDRVSVKSPDVASTRYLNDTAKIQ